MLTKEDAELSIEYEIDPQALYRLYPSLTVSEKRVKFSVVIFYSRALTMITLSIASFSISEVELQES